MHDTSYREVCGAQVRADLLIRFPDSGLRHTLVPIKMASNDAVIPILISGIGAPEEQDVVLTEQEDVHRHWESGMHRVILLRVAEHMSYGAAGSACVATKNTRW